MAELTVNGMEGLMLSMQELANIPEDVQDEILNAQADVVIAAQQKKARAYGLHDTGLMIRKIGKTKVKNKADGKVIYVYPQGSRKRGKTVTRNAEIAFVGEYGTRSQRGRPFVRDANEESAEATTQAGAAVLSRWQESKGL